MTLGEFKPPIATNVSFVFIDDTKSIDNLNITLTTLKAMQNMPIFLPHFYQNYLCVLFQQINIVNFKRHSIFSTFFQ